MTMQNIDPELDLLFERIIDVPRERVWQAWTNPALLMPWFCPLPWKTVACEIDLRPGGRFYTKMQSPEGQTFPNEGCYLEVIPNEKLVWTNALAPGFRPVSPLEASPGHKCAEFLMTASISLMPHDTDTSYSAWVQHADSVSRAKHEQMGFKEGWGMALDQLVAMIKSR